MFVFFFNDTATTEIYTLSLHDALPIFLQALKLIVRGGRRAEVDVAVDHAGHDERATRVDPLGGRVGLDVAAGQDRKSTRLNSSHANISYAVFCLKKKK